ncbi:MAG: hypothetical protein Q7J20_06205 [Candidatus Nitrotoga sp.]|nr:hypothetical protein [Candidatus Nitrotoga sp.]MDO9447475.1 hypothetical protein [Candidatus Nitrotoga sp.]MDP1638498.1 hypothetical protein [Candidatus Nitrotoga sp.]MDP3497560.1 hypothetical protein [Candidatus Nitrotoga sp.]
MGLSCTAIFEKRLNYPSAFDQFDIERIACHNAHKKSLLWDAGNWHGEPVHNGLL